MFESIQGRLAAKEPTRVVVETGGVGFSVVVPLSDHDRLPPVGGTVRLLLHLEVREDLWRLFGFLAAEEREAFRRLLTVKSVGPATAMALLSTLGWQDLARAVADGDTATLTRVKGVGRRTADLVIAELRASARRGGLGPPAAPVTTAAGPESDAVRALVALGLDPVEARRRVASLAGSLPEGAGVSQVVRAALRAAPGR